MKAASTCFIALGLLIAASGCGQQSSPAAPPQSVKAASSQTPPEVSIVRPERKSLRRVIDQPASVEAFEETPLFARISGYIRNVHVDIGDQVKGPRFDDKGKEVESGQVLAELWVPEMEEELRQKRALVAQSEAELKLTREAVAVADADRNRLKSQFERLTKVGNSGVLDKEIVEETRNGYEVAKAKWSMAQADVGVKQARLEVAKAEEARFGAMLHYSKIRAPYDGVITSRNVHTGYYLSGTGIKPLFVIARMDTVRVLVDVPEAEAGYISLGTPARVRCQVVKGEEFEGKVTRTSFSLDAKARTLRTEVHLPNLKGRLRPGMYAHVTFTAELPAAFTLPAGAITTFGEQPCCFIAENGKAVRTPVRVGVRQDQVIEVLKKQAPAQKGSPAWVDFSGEEAVVMNPANLFDGQAITVRAK